MKKKSTQNHKQQYYRQRTIISNRLPPIPNRNLRFYTKQKSSGKIFDSFNADLHGAVGAVFLDVFGTVGGGVFEI